MTFRIFLLSWISAFSLRSRRRLESPGKNRKEADECRSKAIIGVLAPIFSEPFGFRNWGADAILPFFTFFSFYVINLNPSSIAAVPPSSLPMTMPSGDPGRFLGPISSSVVNPLVIAIKFDTLMDVEFEDINGNHAGVDLDIMVSAQIIDLHSAGIDLKSGNRINAWIDYNHRGVLEQQFCPTTPEQISCDRPSKHSIRER